MSDYPKIVNCGDKAITLCAFEASHLGAMKDFASGLDVHDLLFVARDLQHPKVIIAWLDAITDGEITSLVAMDGARIVGTTAIVRDKMSWSAHVAEIRLMISPDMRGAGLGRILLQHSFIDAVEAGAEKLMARMTPDQRGAIALFEEMGFRGEAMLRDHVRDRSGELHDLAVFSLDVARSVAHHGAYGFSDAH